MKELDLFIAWFLVSIPNNRFLIMKITLNLIDTVGYPKSAMQFVLFILSNQVHKMDCYIISTVVFFW